MLNHACINAMVIPMLNNGIKNGKIDHKRNFICSYEWTSSKDMHCSVKHPPKHQQKYRDLKMLRMRQEDRLENQMQF